MDCDKVKDRCEILKKRADSVWENIGHADSTNALRDIGYARAVLDQLEREVTSFFGRDEEPDSPEPVKPIYKLIAEVKESIAEYDKSRDHLRHDEGADCIRCRIVAAFTA